MGRPTKEYQAFDRTVRQLLTVPKTELDKRMAEHRARAAQNPRKRGPKSKVKPPSVMNPDEESGSG